MDGSHLWSYAHTPITLTNPSRSARRRRRATKSKRKPPGYVLYEGPSMLDGAPIVVIATGFNKSVNKKTGAMIQTWIMRADMDPQQALYAGADSSICGACPHRGEVSTTPITRAVYRAERAKQRHHRGTPYYDPATGAHALRKSEGRACYVVIAQAPLTVWRAWRQGAYPLFDYGSGLLEGRILRMGSYGDPVAVPAEVWAAALVGAKGRTGYTHQWKLQQAQAYRDFLMASADTEDEARAAEALGWRAFRVRGPDEPLIAGREVMCPASTEYRKKTGKKVTCAECLMCGGADSRAKKSVSIIAHGSGKRFAIEREQRRLPRVNPRVPREMVRAREVAHAVMDGSGVSTPADTAYISGSITKAHWLAARARYEAAEGALDARMRAKHGLAPVSPAPPAPTARAKIQGPSGWSPRDGESLDHPQHGRGTVSCEQWVGTFPDGAVLPIAARRSNPRVPGGAWPPHDQFSNERVAALAVELSRLTPRQIIDLFDTAGIEVRDFSGASYQELALTLLRGYDERQEPGYDDPDETLRGNPGDDELRRLERELTYGDPAKIAALRAAQARRGQQSGVYENMIAALGPGGMPKKGFAGLTVGGARLMVEAWLRSYGWRPDYNARRGMLSNDVWISPDEQRRAVFGKSSMSFEIGGRGAWGRDKDFEASLGKTMMGTLGIKQAAAALLQQARVR